MSDAAASAILPRFRAKLAARRHDLTVVLWGDSLLARAHHTTAGDLDPRRLPPMMHTRKLDWYLWHDLGYARPAYRRFDCPGAFQLSGAWTASEEDPAWDDAGYRPALTACSADRAAAITWTVPASPDAAAFSLIDRTEIGGAEVLLTVHQGAGRVEVYDEATGRWCEANGHRFSQVHLPAESATGRGNTLYQRRLRLRQTPAHVASEATLTAARAGGGQLCFWGIEEHGADQPVLRLINSARGSHTLEMLLPAMDGDVIDRRPDLVLLEVPLLNMVHRRPEVAYSVNWLWDVVWGDRPGAENDWALARRARLAGEPWAAFEVLLLLPHHSQPHLTPEGRFAELAPGLTAAAVYDAVRRLVRARGDVPLVDMAAAFLRQTDGDRRRYHAAIAGSAPDGPTLTTDGVHQNDRGTLIYRRELCRALGLAGRCPEEV